MLLITLTWFVFFIILFPLAYLLLLALSSAWPPNSPEICETRPSYRFAIAIPAHNEENVIGDTVTQLRKSDYPGSLFDIHIVVDYSSDKTAAMARAAGAFVHERNEGPRTGKGAALSWLFRRILTDNRYDAVVIFDADTQVDPNFLRVMDARLDRGDQVVQGQHIISNPEEGWFPAMAWAMFLVDDRFQNLGRSNLGWSAKNMGDSICLRADVLGKIGWGEGLTEDYQLRQRLLLEGIKINYEPSAKGYGEAPLSWQLARAQRSRWLRGTRDASQQFAHRLLSEGIKRRDCALLDGAFQAYFPSYSTLTLVSIVFLIFQLLVNWVVQPLFPLFLVAVWALVVGLLFLYPLFGLSLGGAPSRAYLAVLSGPVYILWRTWLAFASRFRGKKVSWVRTAHGGRK
jgi:cellulose synthase/poly-beta-1,6-N-acetylglucosamine synthase-like glycosyltransferase